MARKTYLVDTENVGIIWKHLLEEISSNDKIILFYTEKTPNLSYLDLAYLQNRCDKFTLEKCYVGKNALDFQLVSYMGYHMKSSPKTHFCIVSNDSGYDAVIQYWADKDRTITRMTTKDIVALSTTPLITEPNKNNQQKEIAEKEPKKETRLEKELRDSFSKDEIQELLMMLDKYSIKELQPIHREIQKKYGQVEGNVLYHLIKPLMKDYYK